MAVYKLSEKADQKITEIYGFSLRSFGEHQADKYYLSLHNTMELLAEQPKLGRVFHKYRRHEHESHVLFYTIESYGILIIHILHIQEDIKDRL